MLTIRLKLPRLNCCVGLMAMCSAVLVLGLSGCHDETAPADSSCCVEYNTWIVARGTVTGAPVTPDRRVTVRILPAGCDSAPQISSAVIAVDANGFYEQGIVISPHHWGPTCVRAETPSTSAPSSMVTAQKDSVFFNSGPDSTFVTLDMSLASR